MLIIQVFVHIGLLITYCDSFEAEHVPKETEKFIGHKNMKTNKFRIQSNNSIRCGHFCVGLIDFMLFAGKTLIDFTSLFSSFDFEKIPSSNLSDQTKFRLNEINKIKDNFNSEIQEKKTMSKKLSKYITAFDYIGKTLIVLSATRAGVSIISFASVIGLPAAIASASFTFV